MTRALSAFLWLFVFTALAGTAHAADDAPSKSSLNDLLGNASQAVRSENYRGILVYLREGQLDTLRVIHRYSDGLEQERLVSLTGQPREVIRRGGVVTSILPDSQVVLISRRKRDGLLGSVTEFSAERMRRHYKVSDEGQRRLADRVGRELVQREAPVTVDVELAEERADAGGRARRRAGCRAVAQTSGRAGGRADTRRPVTMDDVDLRVTAGLHDVVGQ